MTLMKEKEQKDDYKLFYEHKDGCDVRHPSIDNFCEREYGHKGHHKITRIVNHTTYWRTRE